MPFKYNFGKRRATLRATLRLLEARNARCLVETGTARNGLESSKGDGASTIVFGLWAKQNQGRLYSVDIDPDAVENSQLAVDEMGLGQSVNLICTDSIQFLRIYSDPVDFLCLDSYDYSRDDIEIQKASQQHHVSEFFGQIQQSKINLHRIGRISYSSHRLLDRVVTNRCSLFFFPD